MRLPLLFILISLSLSSFSQTKKETQDWIKEKIESFSYTSTSGSNSVKHTYKVVFTDCNMTITEVLGTYITGISMDMTTITEFPVKDLAKPNFVDTDKGVTLYLRTKTADNIKEKVVELDKSSTMTEKEYRFSSTAQKDSLPTRLFKAFTTLVKLCGGEVNKEIF